MKILMVVAPKVFRDEELFEPKAVFEACGHNVEIASKGVKVAYGRFGGKINVDMDISEVNPDEYAAIVFVGGGGAQIYFNDPIAHKIALGCKGILAAICIGPSILANAGLLKGKKATAFSSEESNLKAKGAIWTGQGVSVDGRIVTADGPESAREFGKTIVRLLA